MSDLAASYRWLDDDGPAFGSPGLEPRWTSSRKDAVATAYSASSRVWFTLSHGILNEIYYPTIDRPQTRDMELLFTDGETFCHEEKRDLEYDFRYIDSDALAVRVTASDLEGRYTVTKEFISNPHYPAVLMNVKITGDDEVISRLRCYALLAPHLNGGGAGNSARSVDVAGMMQSLATPYDVHLKRFLLQWGRAASPEPLASAATDDGTLMRISHNILLTHEDKTYSGAFIASASIPWGASKGDSDLGGYHLVWTRDMVQTATALLACGRNDTALRALAYLACTQRPDGSFAQNFWIDGTPYWTGIQLDEVAFPIILAWRLWKLDSLGNLNVFSFVERAAAFLVRYAPVTQQERWEETAGYSPSTLAAVIAGLICAADIARAHASLELASFLETYADWIESHLDEWTTTTEGILHPDVKYHYMRIRPPCPGEPFHDPSVPVGSFRLANRGPGERHEFEARE